MATPREVLADIIAQWRNTRRGGLCQRKRPGLVKDWHRARLLNLQAAYMLMTRAGLTDALNRQPDPDSCLGVRCDEPFLEVVQRWVNTLSPETLIKAYQATQDTKLFLCFLGLYIDHNDMGLELARRVEEKRFTVELIRTQWGGEDRSSEMSRLFNEVKRFAPDLRGRFLKDTINEAPQGKPSDFEQMSWQRALEWWDKTTSDARKKIAMDKRDDLVWFETMPLLPHERAFFDGPITTAWRGSLPNILADHEALPQADRLPTKLREIREAEVDKIERRQRLAPIAKPLAPPTYDEDERESIERNPADDQMFLNWTRSTDSDDEKSVAPILALARLRGEPTSRFVKYLLDGMTPDLAAEKSGLSPSEQAAFVAAVVKRLRR